jgi:hypothetical protein
MWCARLLFLLYIRISIHSDVVCRKIVDVSKWTAADNFLESPSMLKIEAAFQANQIFQTDITSKKHGFCTIHSFIFTTTNLQSWQSWTVVDPPQKEAWKKQTLVRKNKLRRRIVIHCRCLALLGLENAKNLRRLYQCRHHHHPQRLQLWPHQERPQRMAQFP